MAWIESHQELRNSGKLLILKRTLDISRPAAIGHLHLLWWWALDEAEDGNLSKYPPEVIAEAAEFGGAALDFFNALVKAGFVDADGTIHNWHEYAGRLVERRRADAERKKSARSKDVAKKSPEAPKDVRQTSSGQRQSEGCPADVQRTNEGQPKDGAQTAHVTVPYRTEQNINRTSGSEASGSSTSFPKATPADAPAKTATAAPSAPTAEKPVKKLPDGPARLEIPQEIFEDWTLAAEAIRLRGWPESYVRRYMHWGLQNHGFGTDKPANDLWLQRFVAVAHETQVRERKFEVQDGPAFAIAWMIKGNAPADLSITVARRTIEKLRKEAPGAEKFAKRLNFVLADIGSGKLVEAAK